MAKFIDLSPEDQAAHRAALTAATAARVAAEASHAEAMKHLSPGPWMQTYKDDSFLILAQRREAEYEAAFAAENALLYRFA